MTKRRSIISRRPARFNPPASALLQVYGLNVSSALKGRVHSQSYLLGGIFEEISPGLIFAYLSIVDIISGQAPAMILSVGSTAWGRLSIWGINENSFWTA
jgi:hypothetical protein